MAVALVLGFFASRLPNENAKHLVSVDSYSVFENGRTLELYPNARCLSNVILSRVAEGPSAVRVRVTAKNDYRGPGPACGMVVPVHLLNPLGHRVVIDDFTGKVASPR